MSDKMNDIYPHAGQRVVIAIVGNRNAGKSSLLNALTGQDVSIVSKTPGTTTDAVVKPFEMIPAGAVSFYDTAGLDDEGEVGEKRVKATQKIIRRADLIIYVIGKEGLNGRIEEDLRDYHLRNIPLIPVFNFADEVSMDKYAKAVSLLYQAMSVSAKTGQGIDELKERIVSLIQKMDKTPKLLADLIEPEDLVLMVTPIDAAAPKGRLIMPQTQALREVLDNDGVALVVKPENLVGALDKLKEKPALVVTDSQAVNDVVEAVPEDVALTTFSMLFARAKWDFKSLLGGAKMIDKLDNGDKILIAEGCSHRLTCNDIGRVKIPNLLKRYTGKEFDIEYASGNDFPEDLSPYKLVIHCGGCMLNQTETARRLELCQKSGVPLTNYGMVISLAHGVLERASQPLL